MIEEVQGDLLSTGAFIIVHGTNCQGVMGSGVAKSIRDKYPEVYKAYREIYEIKGNKLTLGSIIPVLTDDEKHLVVNANTQEFYGRDGKMYASYDAIRNCLQVLREYLYSTFGDDCNKYFTIAMPKIGCGLGGANWSVVKDIIEKELDGFKVEVYYL